MTARPSILIVDDDAAFRNVMAAELAHMEFDVSTAGTPEEALRRFADSEPAVVLLDLRLSGASGLDLLQAIRAKAPSTDVIMVTGHGTIDTAIQAVRMGAFDYVSKPCPLDELEVRIRRALERQSLKSRASLLERGLTPPDLAGEFVGRGPEFVQLLSLIARAGPSDSTVLILGETGSGKEMVAKLLHGRSSRRKRPFVTVECAALQENLLQSELFGHERGAFTGADRAKPGLFEVAHGGTLLLDAIAEVSLATQVKPLRGLDTSTFRHVGGTHEIRVDVRVVAATNRDLASLVRQSLFREYLYYRLSTLTMRVPPLRDRGADIDLLADHFVAQFNQRFGVKRCLGHEARLRLRRHPWPGNVRELLHAIEAAMVLCDGPEILPAHLTTFATTTVAAAESAPVPTLRQTEREQITRALTATSGRRAAAARMLGISERNLYRKIRAHHIEA
jgi:DNA-binding NtrC family response regulator